jgi:formylglycine-generating enzyme required for sulfatase activity
VIRGGAWSSAPVDLRIANRSRIDAGVRAGYMGLRIAAEAKK